MKLIILGAKILRKDGRGDRDYEIQKAVERVARIAKQSREWIDVYLPKFKKRSKLDRAVTKIEGNFRRKTFRTNSVDFESEYLNEFL